MDKEVVKRYFLDFHSRALPNLHEREVFLPGNSDRIQVVIGARRSGKTYLLFNTMKRLIDSGVSKDSIVYINFEHPLLDGITFKDFSEIFVIYLSLFPEAEKKRLHVFFDEPQVVNKWETAVRGLHDEKKSSIYITGSSSRLLSKEIATALRGRSSKTILLSLSLREYLDFTNSKTDIRRLSTSAKAAALRATDELLLYGGYPEVVLESNNSEKLKILKDYYDLTIYKDVIERYSVRNPSLARFCMKALVSSTTSILNINKLHLSLKSQGVKVGKDTLYEYFSILEDCFFAGYLRRFDTSLRKEDSSMPKVYLNDTGFLSLFIQKDYGQLLENAVYLELMRRCNKDPLLKINYWRSREDKEVDFLVSSGGKVKQAIQACYSLGGVGTKERELAALKQCFEFFKIKKGLIITWDDEGAEDVEGIMVPVVPAWKWFLNKTNAAT